MCETPLTFQPSRAHPVASKPRHRGPGTGRGEPEKGQDRWGAGSVSDAFGL